MKFLQANIIVIIKDINECSNIIIYDPIYFDFTFDCVLLKEDEQSKLDLILDIVTSPESSDVGCQYIIFETRWKVYIFKFK